MQQYDISSQTHDWCGLKDKECNCGNNTFSDKCLCQKVSKNKDIETLKEFVRDYMNERMSKQAKDFPGDIYWYNKQGAIDACNVFLMRLNQYE